MEEIIDYSELLAQIVELLKSINVYCWGLIAWNIITHVRNRRETREGRK